jgi:acyl-CoA thioesterase I
MAKGAEAKLGKIATTSLGFRGAAAVIQLLIYIFGGGFAFFIGSGLLLAAFAMAAGEPEGRARRFSVLVALIGMVFVALSAVPWPWWVQGVAAAAVLGWCICEKVLAERRGLQKLVRVSMAAAWLGMTLHELQYQFVPAIEAPADAEIWVIADSVTAGLGDNRIVIWPEILVKSRGITIHDRWMAGATVGSAVKMLQGDPVGEGIILLEIGGNDLLGRTSPAEFEEWLNLLLAVVSGPGREVVMFELPLPPLCNEWGIIQRRAAAKYGVKLIPKRVFVGVLTAAGATLDSVHLSQAGHERMADTVWRLVARVYKR